MNEKCTRIFMHFSEKGKNSNFGWKISQKILASIGRLTVKCTVCGVGVNLTDEKKYVIIAQKREDNIFYLCILERDELYDGEKNQIV